MDNTYDINVELCKRYLVGVYLTEKDWCCARSHEDLSRAHPLGPRGCDPQLAMNEI
jgi:hypothetical protein